MTIVVALHLVNPICDVSSVYGAWSLLPARTEGRKQELKTPEVSSELAWGSGGQGSLPGEATSGQNAL